MYMKDKLHYKRINWSLVVSTLGLQDLFYIPANCKVKSVNKQAYLFLLREFGRKFIKKVRTDSSYFMDYQLLADVAQYKWYNRYLDEAIKIAKTPWIKDVDGSLIDNYKRD